MTAYRPPRDCPVCQTRLHLTQLGCPTCGTGLSGDFEPCQFCGLARDAELDILRVFLASRGNMKELERHLGLSYPTVRARFDALLVTLGLADGPAPPAGFEPPADDRTGANDEPTADAAPGADAAADRDDHEHHDHDHNNGPAPDDPRRATLEALARGDLDVAGARAALLGDRPASPTGAD